MILPGSLATPSRLLGAAASFFAIAACALAWLRLRSMPGRARLAIILAVLQTALFADQITNFRWWLHNHLVDRARSDHLYAQRSGPQQIALWLLAALLAAGALSLLRVFRKRPGAALAACWGAFALCLWLAEVVSLHGMDSFLYQRVDGIMMVRLISAACSCVMGVGILWDALVTRAGSRRSQ